MNTRKEIVESIVTAYRARVEQQGVIEYVNVDDDSVVVEDVGEYEGVIRNALAEKLASLGLDERVRTCEDFAHLGIACCESCHDCGYAHYELDLIELESGGRAWICCALDRALNPQRHQKLLGADGLREIEEFFENACGDAPKPRTRWR
jgi:hypothetical protein